MRFPLLATFFALFLPLSIHAQATPDDEVPIGFLSTATPHTAHHGSSDAAGGVIGKGSNASILGVDSVVNWSSYFYYPGVDSVGSTQYTWQYTMVGHAPFGKSDNSNPDFQDSTTTIGAPIVPVNLDLRNYDGSPRYINGNRLFVEARPYAEPVMKSPVFADTSYSSSEAPTQYTDAVQRAEFYNKSNENWHTLLRPRISTTRTLTLIRGTYRYALNADGTCCRYVLIDETAFLNGLFPPTPSDTATVMGAAEHAGDIHTNEISTFLFANAFLYVGDVSQCCIIGFHSYDTEPGTVSNGWKEKRYVMNYSSWVTPGIFGNSFEDITALSHELSETFNDPFVNNATPWWLAPNGNCQNNLEDGDVVEGLANAVFPIAVNGMTYHPQNEALLQWFSGEDHSSAIDKAYSYPNVNVLTSPSVSQQVNCTAPFVAAAAMSSQ